MAAAPPYLKDPAEIYRQSFATVEAEAGDVLASLDPNEAAVARRLIHACGMIDVAESFGSPVTAWREGLRRWRCARSCGLLRSPPGSTRPGRAVRRSSVP